jgi:hypothetical protein
MVNAAGGTKRLWRRLERRAVSAHEQDVLAALRDFAEREAAIDRVSVSDHGLGAVCGAVSLVVCGQQVTLAGVAPTATSLLSRVSSAGSVLRLVDAGRYGPHWWLTVSNDREHLVILGLRIRLAPDQGGQRRAIAVQLVA